MKVLAIMVLGTFVLAGCDSKPSLTEKQYPIEGKVVSVDAAKKEVELDHKDIPGLMKAMTMTFGVEDAKLLDGLKPGSTVRGKLKVADGKQVLVSLAEVKTSAAAEADPAAEIRESLAKLPPKDRALAEEQRLCPVADKPLGSMDVPVKIDVKGQPVFLCCLGCKTKATKDADATLAKVAGFKKSKSE